MPARTHGMSNGSRIYWVWAAMIQRCTNEKSTDYYLYGGRGIKVCDRWRSFEMFLQDMGSRPSDKHQIDRFPNPNGNYEPGNCRWATAKENMRNRRSNRLLTFMGRTMSSVEWAEELGISNIIIGQRLYRGWSVEETLQTPIRRFQDRQQINITRKAGVP